MCFGYKENNFQIYTLIWRPVKGTQKMRSMLIKLADNKLITNLCAKYGPMDFRLGGAYIVFCADPIDVCIA